MGIYNKSKSGNKDVAPYGQWYYKTKKSGDKADKTKKPTKAIDVKENVANILTDGSTIYAGNKGLYEKGNKNNFVSASSVNKGISSLLNNFSANTTNKEDKTKDQNVSKEDVGIKNDKKLNTESNDLESDLSSNEMESILNGLNTEKLFSNNSGDNQHNNEVEHPEKQIQHNPSENDSGLTDSAKIASLAELLGIGINANSLVKDSSMNAPGGIYKPTNNSIRIHSPEIYNRAKNSIDQNLVRGIIASREMGGNSVISGMIANTDKGIVNAATAQGNAELEAANKTAIVNSQNATRTNELGTKIDMYNDTNERKFNEEKFKVTNADRNALYKGIKNIAAIKMSDDKYKQRLRMLRDKDYQAYISKL